jgi:carbon storage regulator
MLVLTRRINEQLVIGDNIVVQILDIDHGRVRLGITAPRDIVVDREEIHLIRKARMESETEREKNG